MKEKMCQNRVSLLTQVLETIKKYNLIKSEDRIVLGVSGGPDSICMLNILNDIKNDTNLHLNFDIIVAHINHLIRDEAVDDELFVKDFCKKIGVQFYSKSIDAHNKNDRVETIIMNVLRGSGLSGLKGIEPIKSNKYIRPLIECDRFEIEQYCKCNGIEARIDKSNFENIYTRNKIRNVVIPYIKDEFNPNIVQTLIRLSDLIKEDDEFFERTVKNIYKDLIIDEQEKQFIMDLKAFNKQEKVIKSRILLYTISRLFGSTNGIEKIHIEDIIKLCSNNIGNKYLTPNKNIKVLLKNHKIYFINQK